MDRKKLIQIIIFILIVLVLGYVLWYMFWRDAPIITPGGSTPSGQTGQLPGIGTSTSTGVRIDPVTGLPISGTTGGTTTGTGGQGTGSASQPTGQIDDRALGRATTAKTVSPVALKDPKFFPTSREVNFYNTSDNKFYRLQADGQVATLSDKQFFNVDKVSWSGDGSKAILEYPDSSNIYYDFATDKQVTLPKQMTEFQFSANDNQIGYKWMSELPDDDWLGIAGADGADVKFVEPMNGADDRVQVNWSPNSQVIATYWEGKGLNESEVYMIGQNGENFKSMTVQGRGFEGQWLPDGKSMIYQIYSENSGLRPMLWITRADGDNIGINNSSLGIQTWLNKCTITSASAYCAVPTSLPEGAAYVPEVARDIPDVFYKIDLTTGAKTLLALPVGDQQQYSASQVMVSGDERVLYFVDQNTGKLYSINL